MHRLRFMLQQCRLFAPITRTSARTIAGGVAHNIGRIAALFAVVATLLAAPGSSTLLAQEGDGTVDAASKALYVPIKGIVSVDAGYDQTCAITISGGVKCWGGNLSGQVGNPAAGATYVPLPVDVTGLTSGVKQVAAGRFFTCAVLVAGTVKCWGANNYGQLGINQPISESLVPVDVPSLAGVASIAAGGAHVCVVLNAGGVKCWGRGNEGQLGHGSNTGSASPVNVMGLPSAAQQVAASNVSTCVALKNGAAYCWGSNNAGQLGNGTLGGTTNSAGSTISSGVTSIAAGDGHVCASVGSALKCWGSNAYGEASNALIGGNIVTPKEVLAQGVSAVDSGGATNCIIGQLGGVYCWGRGDDGQTGSGGRDDSYPYPGAVPGLQSGVKAISVGASHACAVLDDGGLKCWGDDSYGQLGNGNPLADHLTPADVLAPAVCYELTLKSMGSGSPPAAVDTSSLGCPPTHYLPGDLIAISASPATNQRVQSWSSPVAANPGDQSAILRMPTADITVTVSYAACNLLTLAHSGSGGDPVAAPANSSGCAPGRFASGERVTLTAVPNANQRVKNWAGTSATPAVGSQVNALTMPASAATVTVAYEACFALATSVTGQGAAIIVSPNVSNGCLTGGFVAGETVALLASPAAGWQVKGWSGTSNDASTSIENSAIMPFGASNIGVIYEESEVIPPTYQSFLPTIGR